MHLFEKSRTFLFALIDTLLVEWMLPVFSQAAWRWRDSFFPFTKNNNKTSQERKKKRKKERELLRARLLIHLWTLVSMGISLVLCGGWTTPCSLMLPTLHLCGQLSFGLPCPLPSHSCSATRLVWQKWRNHSINWLNWVWIKACWSHSTATSKAWMKPLQPKAQWLPVSLSKLLLSLCLPQLFYFDGFCLSF